MDPQLYEAYTEWRRQMLGFADDLDFQEEEADFAVWDAADPQAREDFNLYLSSRTLDQVSFQQMKAMEIRYDSEF